MSAFKMYAYVIYYKYYNSVTENIIQVTAFLNYF